jgi:hypothetical protein
VSLLVLANDQKVQSFAATVKDTPIVSQEAGTVVFVDGRVITSDVSKASDRINALGWGSRHIQIVASFPVSRRRTSRSFG